MTQSLFYLEQSGSETSRTNLSPTLALETQFFKEQDLNHLGSIKLQKIKNKKKSTTKNKLQEKVMNVYLKETNLWS